MNKILCLIVCFSFGLKSFVLAQSPEDKFEALQMLERGQPKKGLDKLTALSNANPSDASLLYYLGMAQIKNGDNQSALASFEKGIKANPKEGLNYVGEGYLKLAEKKPAEAKPLFDKALEITKSKNAAIFTAIANAYISNKQNYPEAEKLLVKAKTMNPNDVTNHILLGDLYLAQNNGGEAMTNYEHAADLNTKSGIPQYKIGMLFLRSRNSDDAQSAFTKATTIDPSFALAYKELGELYYNKKEGANAAKAQEKFMSLSDNPGSGKLQKAFYEFMARNYPTANQLFEELIAEPNVLPITYKFYAKSLSEVAEAEKKGNPEQATADWDKALSMFEKYFETAKPEDVTISDYNSAGKIAYDMKQPAKDTLAIEYYTKSLDLDSAQAEARQARAETYYRRKQFGNAIGDYKDLMALRTKPMSADYFGIGRSYYYTERLTEADSAFSKLINLQPTMSVGYLWEAHVKASQDPESTQGLAKPYFEKVIEINLQNPPEKVNKNELLEAYRYLGYYYYLKNEKEKSIENWKKVLEIKPGDSQAQEAIDLLTKPPKPQQQTKK